MTADDALRKLYGKYWAEVRAVTQTHLLQAPADEEWLVRIKRGAYRSAIRLDPHRSPAWHHAMKRAIDIALSAVVLLLSAPVLLLAAICILEDGGPLFSRHVVIGEYGVQTKVLKLRTMVPGAVQTVMNQSADGPLFKVKNVKNALLVTRIGRLLQATSIDELPQLWYVLIGRMSLVGPRFAVPQEAAQFHEGHPRRAVKRPGMTGLWWIEARDNPSVSVYRRLDLLYVDNWSLGLDLAIFANTAHAVSARAVRALLPRGGHRREGLALRTAKPSLAERLEAAQRARPMYEASR